MASLLNITAEQWRKLTEPKPYAPREYILPPALYEELKNMCDKPGCEYEYCSQYASAFERARKQEIDALNKQADDEMDRYVAGWDAGVPGSDCTYVMTCTAIDRNKGEITYTVGKLEDIVEELGKIYEFKQGECQQPYSDPDDDGPESYDELLDEIVTGVMIPAPFYGVENVKGLAAWLPSLTPAVACDVVTEAIERGHINHEEAKAPLNQPRLSAQVPAERTCGTCSKTCDVGVKCWWCGN